MIKDLHIQNYRAFREFKLDKLARVNLIVGRNNTGKTSLLEAVYLLHSRRPEVVLINLIQMKGEYSSNDVYVDDTRFVQRRSRSSQLTSIFYKRRFNIGSNISIRSFSSNKKLNMSISTEKKADNSIKEKSINDDQLSFLKETEDQEYLITSEEDMILIFNKDEEDKDSKPGFLKIIGENIDPRYSRRIRMYDPNVRYLTTELVDYATLAQIWDSITLRPEEDQVIQALNIIEPDILRMSFSSSSTLDSGVLLRVKGYETPVPIESMGEGLRRILAIAMFLVSVGNGVLIIDEIDTGLHYSVQRDMWKLILETAQELNVQVFATTHSWDAVQAFQEALEECKEHVEDIDQLGQLIRLDRKKDDTIVPTIYDYDILQVAVEEGVEVR